MGTTRATALQVFRKPPGPQRDGRALWPSDGHPGDLLSHFSPDLLSESPREASEILRTQEDVLLGASLEPRVLCLVVVVTFGVLGTEPRALCT